MLLYNSILFSSPIIKFVSEDWASTFEVVDVCSILISGQTNNFTRLLFIAFLFMMLDVLQHRDCVDTKPASLLVVPVEKALNIIPVALSGK